MTGEEIWAEFAVDSEVGYKLAVRLFLCLRYLQFHPMMTESDGHGVFVGRSAPSCKVCTPFLTRLYVVHEHAGGVLRGLTLHMMKYRVVSKVRGAELMTPSEKHHRPTQPRPMQLQHAGLPEFGSLRMGPKEKWASK